MALDSVIKKCDWSATRFFEELTQRNILARQEKFVFCRVSGLEGFEEALLELQPASAMVCVSDISDGYTELYNSPRTRRVKTVFMAMRHAVNDMDARLACMETMRELFRQFMSQLILQKTRLEENCIFIDPRISFNEVDRYFFSGCACAYFQVAVDVFTDLRLNQDEWYTRYDVIVTDPGPDQRALVRLIRDVTGVDLKEAKATVDRVPFVIAVDVVDEVAVALVDKISDLNIPCKRIVHDYTADRETKVCQCVQCHHG